MRSFTRCGASATPPRDARGRRLERPRLRAHRARDTPPSQVLRAWARERFEPIVSPQLISELAGVLARPKFDRYVTSDEVADFRRHAAQRRCRSPGSRGYRARHSRPGRDYLVALAKAAEAALVSSERDLLDADIGDLEVLSARDILDRLA